MFGSQVTSKSSLFCLRRRSQPILRSNGPAPADASVQAAMLCVAMWLSTAAAAVAEQNWPQWRGPLGTGAAPEANAAARVERHQERPLEGGHSR